MKILVTGATGFVGKQLVQYLLEHTEATLCLAVREIPQVKLYDSNDASRVTLTNIKNISSKTNWQAMLVDCDVVIHLAACIEVLGESLKNSLAIFRETNVEGTLNLARQANQAGVTRFIYMSSIKVNGESTELGTPFGPDDTPMPQHPYAISKLEAERGLIALAEQSVINVVIIRPPLVYGPDVRGNFLLIMSLLQKKIPLPFGALRKNKRSFVSVFNLVDLITTCITHPRAENQTFLVSDGHDLSTTELFLKLRKLLNLSELFFPLPAWVLNSMASCLGKRQEMMRLTGSLQVDIIQTQQLLDWQPKEYVDDGLSKVVHSYINSKDSMLTE
ncbi:MAG: NAD-dependent epimerase/dehydratase family protein [Legionellaceae bacterium]|nr:NAD-dependent epimerase/dehydratase family protein [Legionellaceae bacterium]